MALVVEEPQTEIQQYFQLANSLFAGKENLEEFLEVQVIDTLQKLHKHIVGTSGSTRLAAHDQPYPFSENHNKRWLSCMVYVEGALGKLAYTHRTWSRLRFRCPMSLKIKINKKNGFFG